MEEKMLTEAEAAEMLGLKPRTLQRWRWQGVGPVFFKLGGAVRYKRSMILDYIDGCIEVETPKLRRKAYQKAQSTDEP